LPLDFFAGYFNPANLQLRLLHYPIRDEREPEQYGAGAHTDAGFLTFLMQHGIGGLQIRRAGRRVVRRAGAARQIPDQLRRSLPPLDQRPLPVDRRIA
jgi:isopenicillin N synthase-like dioxygenase